MKQDEEIYREDILSEVRRIWFDDEAGTLSPAKLVETLGINGLRGRPLHLQI